MGWKRIGPMRRPAAGGEARKQASFFKKKLVLFRINKKRKKFFALSCKLLEIRQKTTI